MRTPLAARSAAMGYVRKSVPLLVGSLGLLAIGWLSPGCGSGSPDTGSAGGAAANATPMTRAEWSKVMAKAPLPNNGCFRATHPSMDWVEVPCIKPTLHPMAPSSRQPAPDLVGDLNGDDTATTSGGITWAQGSFPVVTNVTSEIDGASNSYSLQLNTNLLPNSPYCDGRTGCMGWQQFIFDSPGPMLLGGSVYIQYWLLNYGASCPDDSWTSYQGKDCYRNSDAGAWVPFQPITNLANLVLTATAGTSDTLTFSTGDGQLYRFSADSVHKLNQDWRSAEFNIFGENNSSRANFNDGATVAVQTLTNGSSFGHRAPTCAPKSYTGETNNLTIVPGPCCAFGGTNPGIQFVESNVLGFTQPACPSLTASPSVLEVPAGYGATTHVAVVSNLIGQTSNLGLQPSTCWASGPFAATVTPASDGVGQNVTVTVPYATPVGSTYSMSVACDNGQSTSFTVAVTSPQFYTSPSSVDVVQGSCAQSNVGLMWNPVGLGYCDTVHYDIGPLPAGVRAVVSYGSQLEICADGSPTPAVQSFPVTITGYACTGGPYKTAMNVNIVAKPPCVPSTCNTNSCQGTIPDGCGGTLYCPSTCSAPYVCTAPSGDYGHGTTCCGPGQYLPYDGSPCVCMNGGTWDPVSAQCVAPAPPPNPTPTCPTGKVYCDAAGACTTPAACKLLGGGGGCTPAQVKARTCS